MEDLPTSCYDHDTAVSVCPGSFYPISRAKQGLIRARERMRKQIRGQNTGTRHGSGHAKGLQIAMIN